MMQTISALCPPESGVVSLHATDKEGVIREMIEALFEQNPRNVREISREKVCEAVFQREYDFVTGLGQGLAFPHARIEGWGELAVVAGISRRGIDFSSVDKNAAHCFFLLISSADEPYVILQAMSAILRFMNEHLDMTRIAAGEILEQELFPVLTAIKVDPFERIRVGHIACPATCRVSPETSLKDLARLMHESRMDVLPVVDGQGKFLGEVSSLDVFQVGIPDFFQQLKTISFIKYLDPFEKLFRLKQGLTVRDIFHCNYPAMTFQNTLMEVIFEMTVRRRPKLFVVDEEGALTGVIDRFTIIDKILFY